MKDDDKSPVKNVYVKPEITVVKLKTEEMVLLACKTGSGGIQGPFTGNCKFIDNCKENAPS